MLSKWTYILVGNNDTGKTHFQKYLIWYLCKVNKLKKLDTCLVHEISHPNAPKKLRTLFTINRSFQENWSDVGVDNFFDTKFKDSDICILSSHAMPNCIQDIESIINHAKQRFYNVGGVFFSNKLSNVKSEIARDLNWDEVFYLNNPEIDEWENQIQDLALEFSDMLIRRAYFQ
ncbi:hypothetical protein BGP_3479 [Beggiatoa sp. PS]|nr:hypothetical protein BGP_3479 [Beggiatoa sp. PS]